MLAILTRPDRPEPLPGPDLERMMLEHGDGLLRLCALYLKDHQLAEDAVQETFLRAYAKFYTFRGESSEKTWLTRVAMNICKDMMRRRAYSERPAADLLPEQVDPAPGPEDETLERDRNRRLLEAVLTLEAPYRQVVLLFYYSGLKVNEIARLLGAREGTVKTRLMRARGRLGAALGPELTPGQGPDPSV